ncbi:class I SAM-dependent methyltransferase [Candidatus Peregrinibacteria bacterium]|nr:class I SAM-dependent methyltransferase [Candidatus Peregrinibacteria bacterium]
MAIKISGGNELINPVKLLEQSGIKGGMTVADLGCGAAGHFVLPAAHLVGDSGLVYAVDILPSVLQSVESRAKVEGVGNIKIVWADLEKVGGMKIENGSVDLAILVNDLFQIKDKQTVIKEAARILKSGGGLVVGEWKTIGTPIGPPVNARLDSAQVKSMIQSAGFEFVHEFEAGPYHYGLVFKKL